MGNYLLMLDADGSYESANEAVSVIVKNGSLPKDSDFLNSFHDIDGVFVAQESDMFDYKAEYPFSSSDGYFAAILRLICGLHNTYGGIVIFGVHDRERTAGKNKVVVDDEKINRKLRESLTRAFSISCKKYSTPSGDVEVLLVPKRDCTPPVRFNKCIAEYAPYAVFFRRGAEVLEATGKEIDYLYGLRTNPYRGGNEDHTSVDAALPASPATIGKLLGRYEVIEEVFDWLQNSRDCRFFLWGDGGSGKSTMAYEVARLLSLIGKTVSNKYNNIFDRVIYLSAKKTYLDPETAKIERFQGTDFETALDLYRAILLFSEFGDSAEIQTYDEQKCLHELEELLDVQAQLIIIDDIDTLTTDDIDAGMEQLFSIAARCNSGSKLLYTLRKLPSFARRNSFEVPGLRQEDEFPEFLKLCTRQFSVDHPNNDEAKLIFEESESRPLAIETILGLRRITSDYGSAISRWKSDKSDALNYLFRREYDGLSDSRSRLLLAALVVFNNSQDQETLQSILSCTRDQMQDAISDVREMFLRIEADESTGSTRYSLRSATQAFLVTSSKEQDRFHEIKARVENFNRQATTTPPAILTILDRVRRNRQRGDMKDAWNLLSNKELPKGATEHPAFKAESGITAALLDPPKRTEARNHFNDAFLFGHRHHEMYLCWLEMEKDADSGTTNGIDVCNMVLNATGFDLRTKATIRRKLAYLQALKSRATRLSSPEESSQLSRDSIMNNLIAFRDADLVKAPNLYGFRAQATDSLQRLSGGSGKWFSYSDFCSTIENTISKDVPVCKLHKEIMDSFNILLRRASENEKKTILAAIRRISGKLSSNKFGSFSTETERKKFIEGLNQLVQAFQK